MWEKTEGKMGMQHHMGKGKWADMMIWEKLDDEAKKQLVMRKLDERIMKKEFKIGYLQHKAETLKMMKALMAKI